MRSINFLAILCLGFLLACAPSEPSKKLPSASESSKKVASASHKEEKATKSKPSGASIYRNRCVTCHGANGRMGNNGAKKLPESTFNVAQRAAVVTEGRNIMPAFEDILTPEEIKAVAEFTMTLK